MNVFTKIYLICLIPCIFLESCCHPQVNQFILKDIAEIGMIYEYAMLNYFNNNPKQAVIDFRNFITKYDAICSNKSNLQYINSNAHYLIYENIAAKTRVVATLSKLKRDKEAGELIEDTLSSLKEFMTSGKVKANPPTNLKEIIQYVDILADMEKPKKKR